MGVYFLLWVIIQCGFPWWLSVKESACNVGATGDVNMIPGQEDLPEEGHGNPLQYSCLENPKDRQYIW